MDRSKSFMYKKWTLFTIASVIISSSIITSAITKNDSLIGISIIVAIISAFGLIGAYQENFWFTFIYGVFMATNTIASIYLAAKERALWLSIVIDFFATVVAFCF